MEAPYPPPSFPFFYDPFIDQLSFFYLYSVASANPNDAGDCASVVERAARGRANNRSTK